MSYIKTTLHCISCFQINFVITAACMITLRKRRTPKIERTNGSVLTHVWGGGREEGAAREPFSGSPNCFFGYCRDQKYSTVKTGCVWDALGCVWDARLRGHTATQRSKQGSEKVLGRVSGEGFSEGFLRRGPVMGCTVPKGSEKGF